MIKTPDGLPFQLMLVQPMIQFLISWGPMLLLIAVWIYVMKKGGALRYKQNMVEMKQLAEEQLAEMKKMNETLDRIERSLAQHRKAGVGTPRGDGSASV